MTKIRTEFKHWDPVREGTDGSRFGSIARRSICGSVSFVCASSCDTICVTHLELFADSVAARCFFEPGVGIGVSGLSSGPFVTAYASDLY